MKTLKEALFNKKNIENSKVDNKYGITEDDMIVGIEDFPLGVVVRMMEEQERQGNKADVKVFQGLNTTGKTKGGFDWDETEADYSFWRKVLMSKDFDHFFKEYPEYEKYN